MASHLPLTVFTLFFYHVPHCRNIQKIILACKVVWSTTQRRQDVFFSKTQTSLYTGSVWFISLSIAMTEHLSFRLSCACSAQNVPHSPFPDAIYHLAASSALACSKRSHENLELPEVNAHFYSGREGRRGTKERLKCWTKGYIRNLSFTCSKRARIC